LAAESCRMRLGIDASNLRIGGGLTHLTELLRAADPPAHGFFGVIVWAQRDTLRRIEDRPWLTKSYQPLLDKSLPYRTYWQRYRLPALGSAAACDLLYVPGGSSAGHYRPMVTMSRNLLPYEWQEMTRYGLSWLTLKYWILRHMQSAGLRCADGVIFLTRYAQDAVLKVTGPLQGKVTTIPHGVDPRFLRAPRSQKALDAYSAANPFRLLYVSIVDMYKHQWNVAEAVANLRNEGLPIAVDLVGPANRTALVRLEKVLRRVDPSGTYIRYVGPVPYERLHDLYAAADASIFASSCENMPNILLESMASGLPIACSDKGPMPEVLGDAGVYFDPENVSSIAHAVRTLVESADLRAEKARAAFERINGYSWQRCAHETFAFLAKVAAEFARNAPSGSPRAAR
jgi:glycosyltransferase involved in cell wall biosynthesis